MLQNLPSMLFGISPIFCLLCLFSCFLDMGYDDISYFYCVILHKIIMIVMIQCEPSIFLSFLCHVRRMANKNFPSCPFATETDHVTSIM